MCMSVFSPIYMPGRYLLLLPTNTYIYLIKRKCLKRFSSILNKQYVHTLLFKSQCFKRKKDFLRIL